MRYGIKVKSHELLQNTLSFLQAALPAALPAGSQNAGQPSASSTEAAGGEAKQAPLLQTSNPCFCFLLVWALGPGLVCTILMHT